MNIRTAPDMRTQTILNAEFRLNELIELQSEKGLFSLDSDEYPEIKGVIHRNSEQLKKLGYEILESVEMERIILSW